VQKSHLFTYSISVELHALSHQLKEVKLGRQKSKMWPYVTGWLEDIRPRFRSYMIKFPTFSILLVDAFCAPHCFIAFPLSVSARHDDPVVLALPFSILLDFSSKPWPCQLYRQCHSIVRAWRADTYNNDLPVIVV